MCFFKPDKTKNNFLLSVFVHIQMSLIIWKLSLSFFFLTCFVQIRTQTRRHTLHFVSLVHFNLEQPLLSLLFLSCQQLLHKKLVSLKPFYPFHAPNYLLCTSQQSGPGWYLPSQSPFFSSLTFLSSKKKTTYDTSEWQPCFVFQKLPTLLTTKHVCYYNDT